MIGEPPRSFFDESLASAIGDIGTERMSHTELSMPMSRPSRETPLSEVGQLGALPYGTFVFFIFAMLTRPFRLCRRVRCPCPHRRRHRPCHRDQSTRWHRRLHLLHR